LPPYLAGGGWTPDYPAEFRSLLPARAGYVQRPAGGGTAGGLYAAAELRRYDFQESTDGRGRGLPRATRDPLGHETTFAYDPYGLLPILVTDPVGLTTRATYDYRALQPREVTDANGNRSLYAYTPLGLLESTAAMGRSGESLGDTPEAPGTRLVYDLSAWDEGRGPVSVRTLRRLHHANDTDVPAAERGATVEQVEYSDGFGRLVQTRLQAEEVAFGDPLFGDAGLTADPAHLAPAVGRLAAASDPPRVVVTGWQIYDNKGRVVARYEPFFSTGWAYAAPAERELGQKVVLTYDPMGRVVRTTAPDSSRQRMVYGVPIDLSDPDRFTPTPWEVYSYDANDNAGRTHPEAGAAWQAHWNTPSSSVLDVLGRTVESVERNGPDPATDWHVSRSTFDLKGNLLAAVDPLGRTTFRHVWDLAGRALRTEQLDAGTRLLAVDAGGNVVERRDGRGALVLQAYDAVNRPVRLWARDAADLQVTLRERLVYGDSLPPDQARAGNLRGRLHRHYDEAGLLTYEAYDFKANVVEKVRRTIRDAEIRAVLDPTPANGWQVTPYRVNWEPPLGTSLDAWAQKLLEDAAYRTTAAYDALSRAKTLHYPTDVTGRRRVLRPRYNRAGALERVELDGEVFVERVAYDAKGQRILIAYGNGVMTRYAYDRTLLRLARLRSEHWRRNAEAPLTYTPAGRPPLQDLWFEYDLAGNPLGIEERTPGCGVENNPDAARMADPALAALLVRGDALLRRFEYDPLYRLRAATGRQCKTNKNPRPWSDDQRCEHVFRGFPGPDNAPKLTHLYRETYEHDPAGNLLALAHTNPEAAWTRRFGVGGRTPEQWRAEWPAHLGDEEWPGAPGNQVTHAIDAGAASPRTHWHDANGNLVRETASRHCHWDHADRLALFRTQAPGAKPTVYAAYLYDARGRRVKKLVGGRSSQPEVTVYVDGFFEHYRTGPHENNTLLVMDDQKRIATVRAGSPIQGDNSPPVRYHLADHLGSSSMVVDGAGASVNREEYSPYGETVFGSFARKRYRYAGKERDEESGLYAFGARYYAPWLGVWTSCDPRPQTRTVSLYRYGGGSPLKMVDPLGEADDTVLLKWLEITIDHVQARAAGGPHVDPDNLSFLPRSDNSSKGARPEGPRTRSAPQSLGGPKSAEEFSKAAQNMMSRSFGETEELRRLWNKASQGGKLSYEKAQSAFWELVSEGTDADAKLVKQALAEAGIEKVPGSTRFGISPSATGLKGKAGVAPGSIKPGQFGGRLRAGAGVVRGVAPGIAWGFMENIVQRNIAEADEIRARTGGTEERPTEDEIRANEIQGWRYERVDGKTQWKWDPPVNVRLRDVIRYFMNSVDPSYVDQQMQQQRRYNDMYGYGGSRMYL
ncbi:MAG TPA: RHS repeat-associated core domain-containing protein, partial [Thermoanaerobaculia bacterium]|nr:RHS repeat-associated core domain-containing protein [Thermoanaerobaculia bacterium]